MTRLSCLRRVWPSWLPMRFDLAKQLQALADLERDTDAWSQAQRDSLMSLRRLGDELQAEAWRRALIALNADPATRAQAQALAADPVIYAVLRRFGLLKPSLDERIAMALVPVRPQLQAHGGDVEIVEIQLPDTVVVRMTGACESCPASAITLTAGVKRAIRAACPEIRQVRDLSAGELPSMPADIVSPFASAAS